MAHPMFGMKPFPAYKWFQQIYACTDEKSIIGKDKRQYKIRKNIQPWLKRQMYIEKIVSLPFQSYKSDVQLILKSHRSFRWSIGL